MEEKIRANIIKLHKEQGIAYKHIAKTIGVSPSYLSLWLKRERNFSDYFLGKAAENYLNQEEEQ